MAEQQREPAHFDVTNFTIREMSECGRTLRSLGSGAASMEEAGGRIVGYFRDALVGGDGRRAAALVRLYKTHSYGGLDAELQRFVRSSMGGDPHSPDLKCLVLLGTAGEEPDWNLRENSRGHRAIPLPSEEAVNQAPMVSNLIRQLGLPVGVVVRPDPDLLLDLEQRTYNVFHVPEALGSPFIPAQQDFVVPRGIRSVLGFGGLLPSGEMFAVIIFFKVPVSREAADLFKALSLNVKMALLPFDHRVFARDVGEGEGRS